MAGNYIDKWNANGQEYDIQDAGRGLPLGVATLDNNGRIPYAQLPESAVEFKGYWNANTNTPHLADGSGTKGDMYYVDVAGSQDLGSGTQYFNVGDRVLYDGTIWKNINSTAVKSVNGVLPDAQGNVDLLQNIFSFVFPVGTIYQNASNSTSPATLFGFGTWAPITDAYLACRGSNHIGTDGGAWSKTLTVDNIPQHQHSMQHGHFTDINHGHTAHDKGHTHPLGGYRNVANNATYEGILPVYNVGEGATLRYGIGTGYADIEVNATGSLIRYSSKAGYLNEQNVWIDTPNTGDWGTANPTAISLMPTYVGVYTWKRTE